MSELSNSRPGLTPGTVGSEIIESLRSATRLTRRHGENFSLKTNAKYFDGIMIV